MQNLNTPTADILFDTYPQRYVPLVLSSIICAAEEADDVRSKFIRTSTIDINYSEDKIARMQEIMTKIAPTSRSAPKCQV